VRDGELEIWHPLRDVRPLDPDQDGNDSAQLLGGGPDIVVIAHATVPDDQWNARLLVSSDSGETWRARHLVGDWEGGEIRGRQHEDGTVRAMIPIPDCMTEMAFAFRWQDGEFETIDAAISADLAFFGDRMYSSTGWQEIGSEETYHLPDVDDAKIIEGPYPIAIAGGAYRVDGKRAVQLPWVLSGDERGLVADPAGRIWSNLCGQPHVSTRREPARCPSEGD